MNAVGIDVSKGKNTFTIRRPGDIIHMPPRDIPHTQSAISELIMSIPGDSGSSVIIRFSFLYYRIVTVK